MAFVRIAKAFGACGAMMVLAVTFAGAAMAQSQRELSERVSRLEQAVQAINKTPDGATAAAQDADLAVRILKLEQLVEQLTGQIEETRFRANQTARQVEQLSNDLNLRVATLEQAAKLPAGGLPGGAIAAATAAPMPARPASPAPTMATAPAPSGDGPLSRPMTPQPVPAAPSQQTAVTVPAQAQPAPGGFTIRTDAQGRPLPPDPNQAVAPIVDHTPPPPAPAPARVPTPGAVASSSLGAEAGVPVDVALPEGTPKQQYDYAFDFLKRQDYARAEAAFREFMKRYPKDALAGNAQYWLGETYYVRNDLQKSVIEFMNGYQNYPKSNKAPDNLLKLGMSLSRLGQAKEACTALGRLTKEYPDAGEQIRRSAQQERQRLKCAA